MFPETILLATSNPHKAAEFRAIFDASSLNVVTAADCGVSLPDIDEAGETPEAIAQAKAETTARASGRYALADDTILVVDALGGEPGVRTARYAGPQATAEENRRKLLKALAGVPKGERTARFVCCLHVAAPDGQAAWAVRGECAGRILLDPQGNRGFGYDAYFWVDQTRCTMAALDDDQLRRVTHRAKACRQLLAL